MYNTFLAFLYLKTSGSIISVAFIKEKNKKQKNNKTKTGFEYSVFSWWIDGFDNSTPVAKPTSSAFCASLCASSKDELS